MKIGIAEAKELTLELDEDLEPFSKQIDSVIEDGTMLWLTDRKGKTVGVHGSRIAYVEVITSASRKVGFAP
ncbi:MAG TPA: DUF3107 domain-containing protein [Actinomycetota bacterium]|nr:DUF3107 domain-containing protein [Actinomycetota bacterium]